MPYEPRGSLGKRWDDFEIAPKAERLRNKGAVAPLDPPMDNLRNVRLRNPKLCRAIDRTRVVLDLITDKWVISVIYSLSEGTKRFGRLEREVCGVSQKMLTQTLRGLERDGLIERKVYPVVPPRVEYSLTRLGETLVGPLMALRDWAVAHADEVEIARHRPGEAAAIFTLRS